MLSLSTSALPVLFHLSQKAVLLVNQCVSLIPPDDSPLVKKCCRLITNLVSHQKLTVEGRTLAVTVDWCVQALRKQTNIEVLLALHALLGSDAQNVPEAVDLILTTNQNPIVSLARTDGMEESVLLAVQCLVFCTGTRLTQNQLDVCSGIFTKWLMSGISKNSEPLLHAKVTFYSLWFILRPFMNGFLKLLGASLKGLQAIVEQSEGYANAELGVLLGIAKTYMVFSLRGVDFIIPQRVLPSSLSVPEPIANTPREKKGGKVRI